MRKGGCHVGSVPTSNANPKRTPAPNRPRSDDDRGFTAPPKLPKLSPRLEDTHAYKTRERNRKGLARDRENHESTRRVFRDSPQGRGRKAAGTLHSGHEAGSKRDHTSRPPLGNRTPNRRAADRGKNWRERGERRRTGNGGLGPSPVGEGPTWEEREGGGP